MLGLISFAVPAFYGVFILRKALIARSRGEKYVFTLIDGGLWLRGRAVPPEPMIGVGVVFCLVAVWTLIT